MNTKSTLEELCINTIRFLSIDAVERAKSGHPGTPMGAAPLVFVLWDRFLKHNPRNPAWPDRDRFVLSCGHASMLLYALLYLTGYDLTLDDLKNFRQWNSRTPGHPEYGITPGVEATTGPLGQGFGNAVGMAIAERRLAGNYNHPGYEIINHYTYTVVSDGDLEEGVSSEAASLAGTLRLNKLIALYDDNNISIEGKTGITFTENIGERFRACGWNVVGPIDGMNTQNIDSAINTCQSQTEKPSLIICRTVIGYGSPNKAGTAAVHGEPLGVEEVRLTRQNLGWSYEPFIVPPEVLDYFRQAVERGANRETDWEIRLEAYRKTFPEKTRQLHADLKGDLPDDWDYGLKDLFKGQVKPVASREASGQVINYISEKVHSFIGGSADLAPSTKTGMKNQKDLSFTDYTGRNIHFGVREHTMGTVTNGMALHGGIIPFTGTFLAFYDYMRPPVRLAALMKLRVIFIFTHDSIGLGQDGPTHQPVEQLMGLRSVPGLVTIRPADAEETLEAWRVAVERHYGPTALILSRQSLPAFDRSVLAPAEGLKYGGYVLWSADDSPQIIIISTGSEVHIALQAGKLLQEQGVSARVVSLPSWELFDAQTEDYRNKILPPEIRKRISVEASSPLGWERYTGLDGIAVGISHFGASAPGEILYEKFGITVRNIVEKALKLLQKGQS